MHDADGGIVPFDDQADLSLRYQHRVCVVQHRIGNVIDGLRVRLPKNASGKDRDLSQSIYLIFMVEREGLEPSTPAL